MTAKKKWEELLEFWEMPPMTRKAEHAYKKKIVRELAAGGATQQECARFLGLHQSTISNHYSDEYWQGRHGLKMSIRKWQIHKARTGSDDMLKHLGKTYCEDQKNMNSDGLDGEMLIAGIDSICGSSAQNKSTSSKIQPIDTTSPSDPSDPESP